MTSEEGLVAFVKFVQDSAQDALGPENKNVVVPADRKDLEWALGKLQRDFRRTKEQMDPEGNMALWSLLGVVFVIGQKCVTESAKRFFAVKSGSSGGKKKAENAGEPLWWGDARKLYQDE